MAAGNITTRSGRPTGGCCATARTTPCGPCRRTRATAERLTLDNESARHPVWSSDGKAVYYTSGREGTVALWKVDVGRHTLQRMTMGSGPESDPSVSRDGTTLVYSTNLEDYNVVVRDLASGVERSFGTRRVEQMPRFSQDGSAAIFISDRVDGRDELWEQPLADGVASGEARRVTRHDTGEVVHPAVSPDGRWIAYYRAVEDQRHIWVVSSDGVSPVQFTTDPASDIQPGWSPDGSQLAFTSERDGRFHIWVAPVANGRPAGPARQLTGARRARWLRSGRQTVRGSRIRRNPPPAPATCG